MTEEHWTTAQYKEYKTKNKDGNNKYNAVITEYNGRVYDSKKEANCANELKLRMDAGEIKCFIPQVSIPVTPISKIRYIADFLIIENDGSYTWIDVKGKDTAQSKQKRQQVYENYGIEIQLR